jgi:hypothetical protein
MFGMIRVSELSHHASGEPKDYYAQVDNTRGSRDYDTFLPLSYGNHFPESQKANIALTLSETGQLKIFKDPLSTEPSRFDTPQEIALARRFLRQSPLPEGQIERFIRALDLAQAEIRSSG